MASVAKTLIFLLVVLIYYSTTISSLPQGTEALSTSKSSTKSGSATNGKWSLFYALDDKLALSNGTSISNLSSDTLANEFDTEVEGGERLEERAQERGEERTTTTGTPVETEVTVTDAPTTTSTSTISTTTSGTVIGHNNSASFGNSRMTGKCLHIPSSYIYGK